MSHRQTWFKFCLGVFLWVGASAATAQSLRNVDFSIFGDSAIVVSYELEEVQPDELYDVALKVSTNGGLTYDIVPQTVTGDVGIGIKGSGQKHIYWRVLADLPRLDSDALVVRVTAQRRLTTSGMARGMAKGMMRGVLALFVGNRATRSRSNGVSLDLGSQLTYFNAGVVRSYLLHSTQGLSFAIRGGLRYTALPFIWELTTFSEGYRLKPEARERLLPYSEYYFRHPQAAGNFWFEGVDLTLRYTVLPIFVYFIPSVGVGYEWGWFRLGERPYWEKNAYTLSRLSSTGFVAIAEISLIPSRFLKISLNERISLGRIIPTFTLGANRLTVNDWLSEIATTSFTISIRL